MKIALILGMILLAKVHADGTCPIYQCGGVKTADGAEFKACGAPVEGSDGTKVNSQDNCGNSHPNYRLQAALLRRHWHNLQASGLHQKDRFLHQHPGSSRAAAS